MRSGATCNFPARKVAARQPLLAPHTAAAAGRHRSAAKQAERGHPETRASEAIAGRPVAELVAAGCDGRHETHCAISARAMGG